MYHEVFTHFDIPIIFKQYLFIQNSNDQTLYTFCFLV